MLMFEINIVCLPPLATCYSFKLISFFGKSLWPLSLGRPSVNKILFFFLFFYLFSQNDYDLILLFAVISPASARSSLNLCSRESTVPAPLVSRLVYSRHTQPLCPRLQPRLLSSRPPQALSLSLLSPPPDCPLPSTHLFLLFSIALQQSQNLSAIIWWRS